MKTFSGVKEKFEIIKLHFLHEMWLLLSLRVCLCVCVQTHLSHPGGFNKLSAFHPLITL